MASGWFTPSKVMLSQKERMVNDAKKIVDIVNSMSFVNFGDQQVNSLMMIREIARGIVHNKVEKVTKTDVRKVLSSSVDKMVGSCRNVDKILSTIDSEGIDDDPHSQSVSRMKEIVSSIVTKRAKVDGVDAETKTTNNTDTDYEGTQRMLFADEAEIRNEDGLNKELDIVMDRPSLSGNGEVQDGGEQGIILADGATAACIEVHNGEAEGELLEDAQLVVEADLSPKDGQHEMQETFNGTSEIKNEDCQNELSNSASLSPLRLSLIWPSDGILTLEWVKNMMATLEQSSKKDPPSDFWSVFPISVVDNLINAASSILSKEPNCVEVGCHGEDSRVIVVGDIHGQFHDLLNLFELAGLPSENQYYVFNGDYVDRGAWGFEVFMILLAWKVLMPNRVYLLRGNHETGFCTSVYGFKQEVKIKFGDQGEIVYKKCLECFKELPLASIISSCVYTTHGGLFRSMHVGPLRRSKRKKTWKLKIGSLEDLSKVNRFLIDVPDEDPSVLTDALWSDPSKEDGLVENKDRGLGLLWGPDCTETFLKQSKLKLIIRSHEGPDARVGRDDFGDILSGYSMDHVGESGKLYTLFSAPNYPQFGDPKCKNEGAYAVLKPPNFESPSFHSFEAVERPEVDSYVAADVEDMSFVIEEDLTSVPTTHDTSLSQTNFPAWMSSRVDFESLGISNPPSWSFLLVDGTGGTRVVQVPRAPVVHGLPLPSGLQEPHKAAFEYLFELIAALKHMLSTKMIENGVHDSAEKGSVPNEKEGPNGELNSKTGEKA